MILHRGQVVRADIGLDEPKLFVVVSNNRRNKALPSVLAVRLTTSTKPSLPSIVPMPEGECVQGRAVCDDVVEIWPADEVLGVIGALSPRTVVELDAGLAAALGLPRPRLR